MAEQGFGGPSRRSGQAYQPLSAVTQSKRRLLDYQRGDDFVIVVPCAVEGHHRSTLQQRWVIRSEGRPTPESGHCRSRVFHVSERRFDWCMRSLYRITVGAPARASSGVRVAPEPTGALVALHNAARLDMSTARAGERARRRVKGTSRDSSRRAHRSPRGQTAIAAVMHRFMSGGGVPLGFCPVRPPRRPAAR